MTDREMEKYKRQLMELIDCRDIEAAHCDADDILCEILIKLGYKKIVDIYKCIPRWYA
jgi:hypothetical protein